MFYRSYLLESINLSSFYEKISFLLMEKVEESKVEETQNLSRLYQHTKNKDTFGVAA